MSALPGQDPDSILLSPKTTAILESILDPNLRQRIEVATRHCIFALEQMRRIHLPQDHFDVQSSLSDYAQPDLVPYVLGAVGHMNRLLARIEEHFPAPNHQVEEMDDFDIAFDLVDDEAGESGISDYAAAPEDSTLSPLERSSDIAHSYGSMLRMRLIDFGRRLEVACRSQDSWRVLAELDDFQHRLSKAVLGILFGLLSDFTKDARREEIYPHYRSAVHEAIELRRAISQLRHDIGRFNDSLADPELAIPTTVAVSERLQQFGASPVYRSLRAEDKRAVSNFRHALHRLRKSPGEDTLKPLRREMEGFSKFLDAMDAINHREVLQIHDRKCLDSILGSLEVAKEKVGEEPNRSIALFTEAISALRDVVGRDYSLDEKIRVVSVRDEYQPLTPSDIDELFSSVKDARERLR